MRLGQPDLAWRQMKTVNRDHPQRKRVLALAVVGAVLATSLGAAAAGDVLPSLSTAADVTAQASPVPASGLDVVNIYNRGTALADDVAAAAVAAATASRAAWAFGRGSSISMIAVRRGGAAVQQAPGGFSYPMSLSALPLNAIGPLMGRDVARVLANGFIVMGRTTAGLRGAQVGDNVDLIAADGAVVTFTIGLLADDAVIGGTEILVTPEQADALGATTVTRILAWGFDSRDAMNQQLAAVGLDPRVDVRIRRSWDPFDPDSQIGMAETKAKLGEFAFRVQANGADASLTGDWEAGHLPPDRQVLSAAIPIKARCNLAITADLSAALDEVAAVGLGGAIDVGNANTFGGCFYPRFNRLSGNLGILSRHTWAQALDTNTTSNPQGGTPHMNCDVVRIFRKHNFVWGGNFLTPDGMHFEWVGTRRDQYLYPSRYCPNVPGATGRATGPSTSVAPTGAMSLNRATMLADDGFGSD
ncbi:MAG: hypothetical protein JWN62_4056 [Acidimicrobiales bacterium]|nr:hypothetical protein [Acidimicrobiales bacterium]